MNIELPAVISALQIFSIEAAAVERHAPMRAGVAQRKRLSHAVAADDQRSLQQRRLVQLITMHAFRGQGTVPESGEHDRVGRLALWEVEFGHGIEGLC